jgi:hypothetical protein
MRRTTGAILVLAGVLLAACGAPPSPEAPRESWEVAPAGASATLAARVTFDAMQVSIENRDPVAWRDVLVELRRDGSGRVFRFRADTIVGGRTLPVGALNFEGEGGRRLSPFEGAPQQWRLQATLPEGLRGWASGRVVEVAPR